MPPAGLSQDSTVFSRIAVKHTSIPHIAAYIFKKGEIQSSQNQSPTHDHDVSNRFTYKILTLHSPFQDPDFVTFVKIQYFNF